jgi:hypothetical protein
MTTPSPISDQSAGEPAKLAKDLEDEQTYLASCRDTCSLGDELPRWDRLQRAIDYLRGLSTSMPAENSAIYISKRLTGSDADASFVQAHINQAVSEAMDAARSTAPTTGSAPCVCGMPSNALSVHRQDGPCYRKESSASPAASGLRDEQTLKNIRVAVANFWGESSPEVQAVVALLAASMGGDKS